MTDEIKSFEKRQAELAAKLLAAEQRVKDLKQRRAAQILNADIAAAEAADEEMAKATREAELLEIAGSACSNALRKARCAAFRERASSVLAGLGASQARLAAVIQKHVAGLMREAGPELNALRGLAQASGEATGMFMPEFDRKFVADFDAVISSAVVDAVAGVAVTVDLSAMGASIRQLMDHARTAELRAGEREQEARKRALEFNENRDRQRTVIVRTDPEAPPPKREGPLGIGNWQ
jgi:hypothetical protein